METKELIKKLRSYIPCAHTFGHGEGYCSERQLCFACSTRQEAANKLQDYLVQEDLHGQ